MYMGPLFRNHRIGFKFNSSLLLLAFLVCVFSTVHIGTIPLYVLQAPTTSTSNSEPPRLRQHRANIVKRLTSSLSLERELEPLGSRFNSNSDYRSDWIYRYN